MRNCFSLLVLFTCALPTAIACKEITIQDSGLYGVYVKSMPFWTFWNCPKIITMLSTVTQKSELDVRTAIDAHMPVAFIWKWWDREKYQELVCLKDELQQLHCELDLREMAVTCDEHDDLPGMIEFCRFNEPFQKALDGYAPAANLTDQENLNAYRSVTLDALKKMDNQDVSYGNNGFGEYIIRTKDNQNE